MEKVWETLGAILVAVFGLAIIGGGVYLAIFLLPFVLGAAGIGLIAVAVVFILWFAYKSIKKLFTIKSPEEKPE